METCCRTSRDDYIFEGYSDEEDQIAAYFVQYLDDPSGTLSEGEKRVLRGKDA